MIRPHVSPFEECPKALDAVSGDIAPDIFAAAMVDPSVIIGHAPVFFGSVRIDYGPRGYMFPNKSLQGFVACFFYNLGDNPVCLSFLSTNNDGLLVAPVFAEFLIGMLILFFPADVGFISFPEGGLYEYSFCRYYGLSDCIPGLR